MEYIQTFLPNNWKDLITISPDNMKYQCFKYVILLLGFFSSILYAFFSAFRHDVEVDVPDYDSNSYAFDKGTSDTFIQLEIYVESCFAVYFLAQFFLEFKPEDSHKYEKDLFKIGINYYNTGFWSDLLPLIPLPHMF